MPAIKSNRSEDFDFGNYIARSLVRAGFRHDDVQEAFHSIVMKLLFPWKAIQGVES